MVLGILTEDERRAAHEWWDISGPRGAAPAREVADAIAFLMAAAFVAGVVLDVDGGLHLT